MGWQITRAFGANEHVVCHTLYSRNAPRGIDVAGLGFRRNNGRQFIILFPTRTRARQWGRIWAEISKRKNAAHSLASMTFTEFDVTEKVT